MDVTRRPASTPSATLLTPHSPEAGQELQPRTAGGDAAAIRAAQSARMTSAGSRSQAVAPRRIEVRTRRYRPGPVNSDWNTP